MGNSYYSDQSLAPHPASRHKFHGRNQPGDLQKNQQAQSDSCKPVRMIVFSDSFGAHRFFLHKSFYNLRFRMIMGESQSLTSVRATLNF
jgi:hypothetical protein